MVTTENVNLVCFPCLGSAADNIGTLWSLYSSGSQPGVLGPLGVRNTIFGGRKCDFRGWEFLWYCWMYVFSK